MPVKASQKPYKPLISEKSGVETENTHIGVEKPTHKKIALLARIHGTQIKSLVGEWADLYWNQALEAGLVTDAMIQQQARSRADSNPQRGTSS